MADREAFFSVLLYRDMFITYYWNIITNGGVRPR